MKLIKHVTRILKSVWVRTEKYCVISYYNMGWYTETTQIEMPFSVTTEAAVKQRPYTGAGPDNNERSAFFQINYFIERSVRFSGMKLCNTEEVIHENTGKTFFIGGTIYEYKQAMEEFPKGATCIENAAQSFAKNPKTGLVVKTNSIQPRWMPFNEGDIIL
jgi:hypothetical protein